jgi:hypothetical protein
MSTGKNKIRGIDKRKQRKIRMAPLPVDLMKGRGEVGGV